MTPPPLPPYLAPPPPPAVRCSNAACLNERFRRSVYGPWPTDASLADAGVLIHCGGNVHWGKRWSASLVWSGLQAHPSGPSSPRDFLFNGCDQGHGFIFRPGLDPTNGNKPSSRVLCGNFGDCGASCDSRKTWRPGNPRGSTIPEGLEYQATGGPHGKDVQRSYNEFVLNLDDCHGKANTGGGDNSLCDGIEASFGPHDFCDFANGDCFHVSFVGGWEAPFVDAY